MADQPTTTLSDLELVEAEVAQIVVDWWEMPIDTSSLEDEVRLEPLTGLLRRRVIADTERLATEGKIRRSRSTAPIGVLGVAVDTEEGTAEVQACIGAADEVVDAESFEVIAAADPDMTVESLFQLQLVEQQWLISEWLPSTLNGGAVQCEVLP
jgi:hypothetical protein